MLTNLFADLPAADSLDEQFLPLLSRPDLRIERIVSTGQASPPGFWYEQTQREWVMLVSGQAELRFEDESAARVLRAGDFFDIPNGRRHRVEATHPTEPTIWLAIHYGTE